jgi:superfamily II DNA/RNA helicase
MPGRRRVRREAILLSTVETHSPTVEPGPHRPDPLGPDHEEAEEFEPLAARAPVTEDSPLFADLGVDPVIVQALAEVGIVRTFAIQELTLPIALGGADLIGQARTGTGKTLGFGIPLLQRISPGGAQPQALVVVPTRELCIQVTRDLATAGGPSGVRCAAIYGGRSYEPQVAALRKGVDVVVGTPGRLLDLANQRRLRLGAVSVLVLDEADEMLDLGFLPDIERIIAKLPEQRQTMLFSATMPGPIVALARRFMRQPVHIRAEAHHESTIVPTTEQFVYRAHALDKVAMLARILQARDRGLTMIFCRTKRTAQKIAEELAQRGFAAAAVHGDLGQGAREQALRAFRSGKVDTLVATDVAARGLDVEDVTHVINYQCPEDEKVYLHRIGRTARAGKSGTAITLVDWDEVPRWRSICDSLSLPFHEPAETYSTSEHLFIDLDIPADAGEKLPESRQVRAGLAAEEVEDLGETERHFARRGPGERGGRGRRRRGATAAETAGSEPARRWSAQGAVAKEGAESAGGPDAAEQPRQRRARRRTRGGLRAGSAAEQDVAGPGSEATGPGGPRAGGPEPAGPPAGGAGTGGGEPAAAAGPASAGGPTPAGGRAPAGEAGETAADGSSTGARRRPRRRGGRHRAGATRQASPPTE